MRPPDPELSTAGLLSAPGASASNPMHRIEQHPQWDKLARLPVTCHVRIPLSRFTVRDLLLLAGGQTLGSPWPAIEDVPLKIGAVELSCCEFEVVDQKMAVRLTRLS